VLGRTIRNDTANQTLEKRLVGRGGSVPGEFRAEGGAIFDACPGLIFLRFAQRRAQLEKAGTSADRGLSYALPYFLLRMSDQPLGMGTLCPKGPRMIAALGMACLSSPRPSGFQWSAYESRLHGLRDRLRSGARFEFALDRGNVKIGGTFADP